MAIIPKTFLKPVSPCKWSNVASLLRFSFYKTKTKQKKKKKNRVRFCTFCSNINSEGRILVTSLKNWSKPEM